ncbi:Phosphatidylinositol 4-kinase stt4 [Stygiomarasmius scandens]|uniref:1-phosphatidylinositol 4-kinase n=1 Tax=Marasmiellus scandens TaxID=2682957 RepID=A0ABR1JUW3_9AGAR
MDFLELNIHQRILNDIASSAGESDQDLAHANTLIAPKVQTRAEVNEDEDESKDTHNRNLRVFMPASRVHCNIAFGELIVNFPSNHIASNIDTLMPVLVDVLRDVPYIDFDRCLSWEDWALSDQLVYSTVSALLQMCSAHPRYGDTVTNAIIAFISDIIKSMQEENALDILTQLTPALHGLYRAIISTPFAWNLEQWQILSKHLQALCGSDMIDRLNRLLTEVLQSDTDIETLRFIQTFIARYVARGRPLSGYFIVCCIIETSWTILAQVLAPPPETVPGGFSEAAAANKAWNSLMRQEATEVEIKNPQIIQSLRSTISYAMQCFTDLLVQIEDMESEPSVDTYAWETMSESLKLASVSSVILQELDEKLFSRLLLLLSEESPISDNLVQEAALKATTIVVRNFPDVALQMATHLRRFVTSPIPIFELEFASESRTPPPLVAAAKCLALCIRLAPGDDLIMSNMYSLLNYIAATSKEIFESSNNSHLVNNPLYSLDQNSVKTVETGLRGLSDEEKRLVGISTISVVTRLALEFHMEEVTRLTISMLLQRLRSAEPIVEAAIAYNLVDLALSAPENAFVDIIRVFSTINRSANPEDPRYSNNRVLAAQTRLGRELHRRPELYEIYLVELLTLFADKGVAIQNLKVANHHVKTDDMIEQLASLLLPIDALLAHEDFVPTNNASPALVSLFRKMWFLCVLFHFTVDDEKEATAMEWQKPALARIAAKTPAMVLEESHDSVASDVEYNSVIRQEYAHTVISKHRSSLTRHIALRVSDIKSLSSGQIIFLLAMHDMESMRSAAGLASSLVSYFVNDTLNRNPSLSSCMEAIAEKVIRGCISDLNIQAAQQSLPECLSSELRTLLVGSTHRIEKARDIASKFLNRLITSFPSLMCDPPLVFAILEVLTLLRRSCQNEFTDEFNPVYEFESDRTGIVLQMTDSYQVRNEILLQLQRNANNWFELALGRAPIELQSTLQKYLAINQTMSNPSDSSELGATIAEKFGKAVGPVSRQLTSLSSLANWKEDKAKVLTSQIASKTYFAGEAAGLRLASRQGTDKLEIIPPRDAPSREVAALKKKMSDSMDEIRSKSSHLTVQDLKRLLFRCAATLISMQKCDYELLHYLVSLPFEVFTPSAISAAIEAWTWVIAEKPSMEIGIMSEILSAWSSTISNEKGIFSLSLNYDDPFFHPISYSPTDKEIIDRGTSNARRLLNPHVLVLQMLLSRLQAARYRRPGVMFLIQHLVLRSARACESFSTHPLAREARFCFLLFAFETLKSSHLDAFCESTLRECLYSTAYAWFSVRPQWSYGANRVQVDADIKILSEFLSYLQSDSIRSAVTVSSLAPVQFTPRASYYATRLRDINQPLKLLVDNEIFRLTVWANPTNDPKRGSDHTSVIPPESTWTNIIRTVWNISAPIAVHMTERFKFASLRNEVTKLVRSSTLEVLDVPEALLYLIGDRLDPAVHRDLKHLLLWAPVPPVVANTFFEPRYKNDPLILQYAHRVLEQHPVDLTFFFVPQVVQALRYDELGYVSRFIFETAKLSQLFCHQIIWNMKANCYKDDAAEIEDSIKPVLDAMTERVVNSLSGEARAFYDREFGFFHEVTSISGKLKPFIKKTKAEKKAKIDEEMAKINVDPGVYLPSNPDGVVVDIDKKSGRPLQSHAKAPFMATFKVRKDKVVIENDPDSLIDGDQGGHEVRTEYDVWQAAIFKVGDDCRQDVLALQIIAMFKNIFEAVGLTLYLFPYRVTATAPGCGVIDVVPNATSRDEMGRAKVNDLLDFFVAKYGGQDTVAFQKARLNFIQSMAAYSVACYILQIKDRHNGNIMIDGEGHIVHIDFGFLFDIDKSLVSNPCASKTNDGVKFEPSSFKLNHEMVVLMGGRNSQGYQLFQHLTVKAFLSIRPHAHQLVDTVQLMLDTGLPSFKGEGTIKRLRDRFALGLNERQAADYMMGVIRNAHENVRSTAYDEFQRLQNGIPYK